MPDGQGLREAHRLHERRVPRRRLRRRQADDGVKNGDETDIDCGGALAPECADGKDCSVAPTARASSAPPAKCAVPTATDGVKNGDETDVDCGGASTGAPPCAVGKACAAHADCATERAATRRLPPVGAACRTRRRHLRPDRGRADHESCCATVAGSPIDKYNITAGRMRPFVERTNGNLRAYIAGQNAPGWNLREDELPPHDARQRR